MTKLVSDIIKNTEAKESTLSVFLDLSKAFDTINHDILLKKLEFYGIRGIALNWFRSYLSDRQQYVCYDRVKSQPKFINFGIPQGSVLGPLLFIIYTNDLPDCINRATTILFADDTTIYKSSTNLKSLYDSMSQNLTILTDWFRGNKLSLNVSKTNYMIFSTSNLDIDQLTIKMDNQTINRTNCTKFLGLFIDDKMKWETHINNMKSRISRSLYAINKIKHFTPSKILKTLYYSMVYPYLTYGITLWGNTCKQYTNKLKVMQKKVMRAISGDGYNAHTNHTFFKYKMLKLDDIYKLNVSKFMLQYIKDELPQPLMNMFIFANHDQPYLTRHSVSLKFRPQKRRTNLASNSILHNGPLIWNCIPHETYLNPSNNTLYKTDGFSSRCKRKLLDDYGG